MGYLSVQTAGAHAAPVAGGLRILSLEIYGFQGAVSIFYVGSLSKKPIDINKVLQPQLRYPTPMPRKRSQFWLDYHHKGIDYVIFHYARGGWLGPIRRLLRPLKRFILKALHNE